MRIFPIYLSAYEAERLANANFGSELRRALDRLWGESSISYSATVENASGDVHVSVTHSSDDGFIMSAGPVLDTKVIKPYTEEQINKLIVRRKFEMAAEEYQRRHEQQVRKEILKIKREMFGESDEIRL